MLDEWAWYTELREGLSARRPVPKYFRVVEPIKTYLMMSRMVKQLAPHYSSFCPPLLFRYSDISPSWILQIPPWSRPKRNKSPDGNFQRQKKEGAMVAFPSAPAGLVIRLPHAS